ncbi:MAG TPA: hypothetical protein IAB58_03455 [Candidatus Pelethosoma merdigallinarum]|nr:hypothetical protein [Candidatus Pelethosoma merdigallinarum]
MKNIIKKYGVLYLVISLFVFSLFFTYEVGKFGWDHFFSDQFSLVQTILLSLLLGVPATWLMEKIFDKIPVLSKETKPLSKKVYIGFSCGMLLIWMIQYLTFFPGGGMGDTINILNDPIGISLQHPIVYNLLFTYAFRFFHLFLDSTMALGCVTFIQMILCSIILSFVCYYLERATSSKYPAIILFLIYALVPIIGNSAMALVKDTPFSLMLLLLMINAYHLTQSSDKKYRYTYFLLFVVVSILRNNGIYIACATTFVLFFLEKNKKLWMVGSIIAIILSLTPSILVSSTLQKEQLFQEKIAIPLQQIASVVKYDGNYDSEKEEIEAWIPIEQLKVSYLPTNCDSIKWGPYLNRDYLQDHKMEFIQTWFHLLPKNFTLYVKAWMAQTGGYWAPNTFQPTQSRFLGLEGPEFLNTEFKTKTLTSHDFVMFYLKTTVFFGCGTCLWIVIFLGLFAYHKKQYQKLIMLVPVLALILTLLISVPVSNLFRYTYIYLYFIPFWFLFVCFKKENTTSKKKRLHVDKK